MISNITWFHCHYLFMFLPTFLWVSLCWMIKNILTYLYSTVQLFSEHQVRTSILPTFFSDAWYNKTIKRDSIKICRFSNYIFVITSPNQNNFSRTVIWAKRKEKVWRFSKTNVINGFWMKMKIPQSPKMIILTTGKLLYRNLMKLE